jgi:hypothetical protein
MAVQSTGGGCSVSVSVSVSPVDDDPDSDASVGEPDSPSAEESPVESSVGVWVVSTEPFVGSAVVSVPDVDGSGVDSGVTQPAPTPATTIANPRTQARRTVRYLVRVMYSLRGTTAP